MASFNKNMSLEEILKGIQDHTQVTGVLEEGKSFLQYKLQQQLLEEQRNQNVAMLDQQNKYNKKQLIWSRWLVFGTWALVCATILLVIFKK